MKENESNLAVVDVEFVPDTNEIIAVERSQGEENYKESEQYREQQNEVEQGQEEKDKEQQKHQGKQEQTYDQANKTDEKNSRDTSFKNYEREESSKEKLKKRGFFAKLSRFCLSTLGIIVAMPVLAAGTIAIVGGLGASLGVIGVGIASVVFTAFLMTVQPGLIGWLGVFVSIGLLSGGGLALSLVILLIRGLKYIVRILRNKDAGADFAVREER